MTIKFKNIKNHQRQLEDYIISTDKSLLDIKMIQTFLSESSYWVQGRPYEVVKKTIEQSLCFAVYLDAQQNQKLLQVGFNV